VAEEEKRRGERGEEPRGERRDLKQPE